MGFEDNIEYNMRINFILRATRRGWSVAGGVSRAGTPASVITGNALGQVVGSLGGGVGAEADGVLRRSNEFIVDSRRFIGRTMGCMQQEQVNMDQGASLSEQAGNARDIQDAAQAGPTLSAREQTRLKAQLVFDACWKSMEQRLGERYVCPREIVWLNGAPGSGKGTNVPFIMKSRGLSRSVGMSQLLDSPEIKSYVDRGELVPDAMVLDALLDAILNPEVNDGAGLVIDGFPRTATQVDFVKLLYDKLMDRHARNADSADEWRSPRPSFKVVILYVDEKESVKRQMKRAELTSLHNERVRDAGTGDVWNVRATDVNEALCRRRYQVFKAHYNTILRLKSYFPFSLIDAMGSLQDCRSQIVRELRYQSSLDLDEKTYAAIRHLPLARDLVRVARQRLVFRLDLYCKKHYKMFTDIISLIDMEIMPVLKQCSMAGHAEYRSRHPLLLSSHLAVDMLIDILTDRGFNVAHFVEERLVPRRVDMKTGAIQTESEDVHSFRITFNKENIRDVSLNHGSHTSSQNEQNMIIGKTFVPEHLRKDNDTNAMVSLAFQKQPDYVPNKPETSPMRAGPVCYTSIPSSSSSTALSTGASSKDGAPQVATQRDGPEYEHMNERED